MTESQAQTSDESGVTQDQTTTTDNVTEQEPIQTTLQESTDAENVESLTTVPNRGRIMLYNGCLYKCLHPHYPDLHSTPFKIN